MIQRLKGLADPPPHIRGNDPSHDPHGRIPSQPVQFDQAQLKHASANGKILALEVSGTSRFVVQTVSYPNLILRPHIIRSIQRDHSAKPGVRRTKKPPRVQTDAFFSAAPNYLAAATDRHS